MVPGDELGVQARFLGLTLNSIVFALLDEPIRSFLRGADGYTECTKLSHVRKLGWRSSAQRHIVLRIASNKMRHPLQRFRCRINIQEMVGPRFYLLGSRGVTSARGDVWLSRWRWHDLSDGRVTH
jgi:hypothetical protein